MLLEIETKQWLNDFESLTYCCILNWGNCNCNWVHKGTCPPLPLGDGLCLCAPSRSPRGAGADTRCREARWSSAASGWTDHPAVWAARLQTGRPENVAGREVFDGGDVCSFAGGCVDRLRCEGVWGPPVSALLPAEEETLLPRSAALYDLRSCGRHGEASSSLNQSV